MLIFVTAAIGNPYSKFAGGPYNKKPMANQPQESHLSPLLARGPRASVISLPVPNNTVYMCVLVCMRTRLYMSAHRRRSYKREDACLKPQLNHQALLLDGTGRARHALFTPSFSFFTSLQGNAIIGTTKEKQCHRAAFQEHNSLQGISQRQNK